MACVYQFSCKDDVLSNFILNICQIVKNDMLLWFWWTETILNFAVSETDILSLDYYL